MVATVATFAALVSHVAAGGDLPGWAGVSAPWMLAVAVSTLLAGRSLSRARLAVSVVVSQLLFHTLFVMGAPSASPTSTMMHGHAHGAPPAMPTMPAMDPMIGALCADPSMWVGHAVAALVTIATLYRGERAARAMLALARDLRAWARRTMARGVIVHARPRRPHTPRAERAPFARSAMYLSVLRRRGPPLSIAF